MKNTVTKEQIRKQYLAERAAMTEEERKEAARKICDLVTEDGAFRDAEQIYCYASFREEAGTKKIIEASLKLGKKVAVPRVIGRSKMEFCYIRNLADLRPGVWSIPEPGPWCRRAPYPGGNALVLMPGAAFDRSGTRIGYGAGYYDTYFQKETECTLAAIAFSCQCTDDLPSEPHDVKVEMIYTEKELIRCLQDCRQTR